MTFSTRLRCVFFFLLPVFLPGIASQAAAESSETADVRPAVSVGLVDTFTPQFYVYTYTPLIETLKARLPQYRFITNEIPRSEVLNPDALRANDFVILSSGNALMTPEAGLEQVATLRRSREGDVSRSVGSVFVVPAAGPLKTIDDLKGRRAAATASWSFEGWQIAMGEIASKGFDPDAFFSEVTFTEWNYPDVPALLTAGLADVGVMGTCELEAAVETGAVGPDDLRVIGLRGQDGPGGCRRSTELYPDVIFASAPQANPNVVKDVTVALLTMPPNELGFDWLSNNKLQNVQALLRLLRIGPYAYLRDSSLRALAERYRTELVLGLGLLAALLIHVARVNRLLRRRTDELRREEEARMQAAEALRKSREQLDLVERAGMVAQLSSMFAHEIKQPITTIANFLSGLRMMTASGKQDPQKLEYALARAEQEAHRAADIIEHVRAVGRRERPAWEIISVSELIARAVRHAGSEAAGTGIRILRPASDIWVRGDPLELELVLVNFLKNAARASSRQTEPEPIGIGCRTEGDAVRISVTDSGPAVSDSVFESLGRVTRSTSDDGMGFGLSIASSIAESHGGHLVFSRRSPSGLCAELVLPVYSERTSS